MSTVSSQTTVPATLAPPGHHTQVQASREERIFLLLSIFIGIISGLLVVSFRMAIEWLAVLLQGSAPAPHQVRLLLAPAGAGVLIALLTRFVFPQVRGSGINQTKAALYVSNGYISIRNTIGKFFVSTLSVGSGFSLGQEDPSLQIGAGIASLIGRRAKLSRERLRLLAPVGAAAGLAAAFNAPISAILFVIEEVIGQWTAGVLGAVVLAAVSAVVVARWFWGSQPLFRIPDISIRDPREMLAYAALGLVGGAASLLFSKCLGSLRSVLRHQPRWAQMLHPVIGGLLVGAIGYFGLPEVMGAGYGAMDQAMHGQFALKMLLLLAAFKIIAATISFSSGAPGGMLAPSLFLGTMVGAAVGSFEKLFFPHLSISIGSYAMVGTGVVFAAFLRAPLTAVFMVLEISQNYSIVLPVILANTLAYLLARAFEPVPIFEQFTHQDGLYLPSMEEEREEVSLHFEDALQPARVPILSGTDTVWQLKTELREREELVNASAILIRCSDGWYAARGSELKDFTDELITHETPGGDVSLQARVGPERTPLIFPDQNLANALTYFHRWPLLPVSNRAQRGTLEGVLTLDDVLKRYQNR